MQPDGCKGRTTTPASFEHQVSDESVTNFRQKGACYK